MVRQGLGGCGGSAGAVETASEPRQQATHVNRGATVQVTVHVQYSTVHLGPSFFLFIHFLTSS